MLTGTHPIKPYGGGSVMEPFCQYSWVWECDYREKGKGTAGHCPRKEVYECRDGQHILLDETIHDLERQGWRFTGRGVLCPEHAPPQMPPRDWNPALLGVYDE